MPSEESAIEIRDLVRHFNGVAAVDGLSLEIRRGEMFCLLGPNGAGKSTLIRMLCCLLPPSSGQITILGRDPLQDPLAVRARLGLAPQEIAVYESMSPIENLRFFGKLYGMDEERLEGRIKELLADVRLSDRAHDPVEEYSGGMKRRINIATGMLHDPDILFLDEPTVGLDPQSRADVWDIIRALKAKGKTVILTTHYMDEARELSDRVAIVERGKLVALGTPRELIDAIGAESVVQVDLSGDPQPYAEALLKIEGVVSCRAMERQLHVHVKQGAAHLPAIVKVLADAGAGIRAVQVKEPNLEDVFIHYVGRKLTD